MKNLGIHTLMIIMIKLKEVKFSIRSLWTFHCISANIHKFRCLDLIGRSKRTRNTRFVAHVLQLLPVRTTQRNVLQNSKPTTNHMHTPKKKKKPPWISPALVSVIKSSLMSEPDTHILPIVFTTERMVVKDICRGGPTSFTLVSWWCLLSLTLTEPHTN